MPLVVKDRVKETTATTGTGTYTLAGATQGFQSFSVIGNGNTTYYAITNGTDWEVGIGTYSTTGPTLARTTILESSNANNAVNWGAGSKEIFCTYPAERSLYVDGTTITPATTATLPVASGGTGANNSNTARANLGASTLGSNLFIGSTGSGSATFPRFNGDQSVSYLDPNTFRTAIGAGTGNGTVTSVGGTGTVNGLTLSGTVTSSGNLTLGGSISNVPAASITGTLTASQGGTGQSSPGTAGNILISNGTSWSLAQAPSSLFSTAISSGTFFRATVPSNSFGTRTSYKLILNINWAVNSSRTFNMDFYNSTGTLLTSNYQYNYSQKRSLSTTETNSGSNSGSNIPLTGAIAATSGYLSGEITFFDNSNQGLSSTGTRMFHSILMFNTYNTATPSLASQFYSVETWGCYGVGQDALGDIRITAGASVNGAILVYKLPY
jgi:hypothetical protein